MGATKCRRSFKVCFGASLENIDKTCLKMRAFLDEAGLSNLTFEMELLAREAMINAVKHGSNMDYSKKIDCQLDVGGDQATLTVRDQGDGFNWRKMLEQANLDQLDISGRGLEIFKVYSSDIEYNEEGNEITLFKKLNCV